MSIRIDSYDTDFDDLEITVVGGGVEFSGTIRVDKDEAIEALKEMDEYPESAQETSSDELIEILQDRDKMPTLDVEDMHSNELIIELAKRNIPFETIAIKILKLRGVQ